MRLVKFSAKASNLAEIHFGPHTYAFIVDNATFLTHEYYSSADAGSLSWANGVTTYSLVGPWFHVEMSIDTTAQRAKLLINGQQIENPALHVPWQATAASSQRESQAMGGSSPCQKV